MAQGAGAFVETQLSGFFEKSFENTSFASLDRKVPMDPRELSKGAGHPLSCCRPTVRVHNARPLQREAASPAAFFDRYGFVLLPHATRVREWNTDFRRPARENDIGRIYWAETEHLVRTQLLPGWRVGEVTQFGAVVRRGPGVRNKSGVTSSGYGHFAHQDFGLDAEDYEDNTRALPRPYGGAAAARAWRTGFDQRDVHGMMVINFWRPVHMRGELRHTPLCVCDPRSVQREDLVRIGYPGPGDTRTNLMMLRHDPGQRWYFYPAMTRDEVLAFKQFDYFKDDGVPTLRTCFHTAFHDPTTPDGAELRQSAEHRVTVYFGAGRPRSGGGARL